VRFYGEPTTAIVLLAGLLCQSQMDVPIPNTSGLIGPEFYGQGIAIPLFSQSPAPAYQQQ